MISAPALMVPHYGDAHPDNRMSYVRFMNQFNTLDGEDFFSDSATRLYVKILNLFNKNRQWDQPQQVNVPFLCLLTGSSENTVKKGLDELAGRGLIAFTAASRGRKKTGPLHLLKVHRLQGESNDVKPSKFDGFVDDFSEDETLKPSTKPLTKPSNFDGTIRVLETKEDVTERGAASAKKSVAWWAAENPDAQAPQAGGGAAGPAPLQPGESARGGFADPRLSDDDPRKWEARPKDAQMVDEYLAGHSDPEIRKHAGKGQLLIDYYEQYAWCSKNGAPIRNWRAVARQFSFIDYKAERKKSAVGAGNTSKVEQVQSGIDDARAFLRQQREGGLRNG